MTTQMIIRIDSEVKNRLNKLANAEGKTTSQIVRELIENYIKERDIGAYIDDIWKRIGERLTSSGVVLSDVDKAIRDARRNKILTPQRFLENYDLSKANDE